MTQKVLQIGTSAGVTISKEVLKMLGLKIGDHVSVILDADQHSLVILPLRRKKNDAEFSAWTKKFLTQYGPALKALAKE